MGPRNVEQFTAQLAALDVVPDPQVLDDIDRISLSRREVSPCPTTWTTRMPTSGRNPISQW